MSPLTRWILERVACDGPLDADSLWQEFSDAYDDLVASECLEPVVRDCETTLFLTERGREKLEWARDGLA